MKGKIVVLLMLVFYSCTRVEKNTSELILSKNNFAEILQQIHLIEAEYELAKSKEKSTKYQLNFKYDSLFGAHNINELVFEETLFYYSNKPEELEEIYTIVLEKINNQALN